MLSETANGGMNSNMTATEKTTYSDIFWETADTSITERDRLPLSSGEWEIATRRFTSPHTDIYPSSGDYEYTDSTQAALLRFYLQSASFTDKHLFKGLHMADRDIEENRCFRYPVLKPRTGSPAGKAIILLHGLNEKSWAKYIPWARALAERTGRPVLLFPLAFHMNRAPASWSAPREMFQVSRERRKLFPHLQSGSLANAALSHRIQFAPHRFITSGLHSYRDLLLLLTSMAEGRHPDFAEGCRIDFFAYSIGASLAQMMLMTNPQGLLNRSRFFLFCGGAVLDEAAPVSKAIIDGEANSSLFTFFRQIFEAPQELAEPLRGLLDSGLPEVEALKSLLFLDKMQPFRQRQLETEYGRLMVTGLKLDKVFPPEALEKTFGQGGPLNVIDMPFSYSHEIPFPAEPHQNPEEKELVTESFHSIFDKAASFLA